MYIPLYLCVCDYFVTYLCSSSCTRWKQISQKHTQESQFLYCTHGFLCLAIDLYHIPLARIDGGMVSYCIFIILYTQLLWLIRSYRCIGTKKIIDHNIIFKLFSNWQIMSSQPQVENLVKRFVWAQFDRHNKCLYYVYYEVKIFFFLPCFLSFLSVSSGSIIDSE
jgi:hypothetical protein